MTVALRQAPQHGYRLSAFERKDHDFYPTPVDLVTSLALGLSRLGIGLPRVALDPCGGDGALRRGLAPFRVDVSTRICTPPLAATLRANHSTPPNPNI
jgi:hypothetical protein